MYNESIENLINLALADGELTENEKQVLFKKAETEGIDLDEFEMVLEARLFEKRKEKDLTQTAAPKSNKFGDVKKCPACGAILQSFSIQCSDCGFEFRNIAANSSVKTLSEKLAGVVDECNKKSYKLTGFFEKLDDTEDKRSERKEKEIATRQREIILNHPVPNTKEDILELLLFIYPKTKAEFASNKSHSAWKAKFKEIIARAKISCSNDPKMMLEIAKYERPQKHSSIITAISRFNGLSGDAKKAIILLFVCGLFILFMVIGFRSCSGEHNEGVKQERERLELLMDQANAAIDSEDYDKAERLANQLRWEYSGNYSNKDTEKLTISWNEKRESIINSIKELKDKKTNNK